MSRAALVWILLLAAAWFQISSVSAVDDFDSLAAEIETANRNGGGTIRLSASIILTAPLPPITGETIIEGDGHSISGGGRYRIFDVSGARLTIKNLTVTDGRAPQQKDGGAILMRNSAWVTILDSAFINNEAEEGGAIFMDHGILTIDRSHFARNTALFSGGVIRSFEGSITVAKSSFIDNYSALSGGVIELQLGKLVIANSTFSNNSAHGIGGAIYVIDSDVSLTHLTMINDRADGGGDAISVLGGNVNLRNSIIAGGGQAEDCRGGLAHREGNLSLDGTCAQLPYGEDVLLGDLTGAPVRYPLLGFSPALDAASERFCLETDQIGTPRPQGGGCDIGAIEATTAEAAPAPIEPPPPCPLEFRIAAANTDRPVGGCPAGNGADTIVLSKNHTLVSALPQITSEITIEGNGYSISGDSKERIFTVSGGKLTLNDLTLINGSVPMKHGGAILIQGSSTVSVNRSRFVNNRASSGGAIGAISSNIRLTVNHSEFHGNRAARDGGAIRMTGGGSTVVNNSSFVNNSARGGAGGAIDITSANQASVSNSTFVGNAAYRGGALAAGYGWLTVTHSSMFENAANFGEGISIYRPFEGESSRGFRLRNSLIVGTSLTASDCFGPLDQNIGSLIADGTCSPMLSGAPMMEATTETPTLVVPASGSPLIDSAHPQYCAKSDQLGRLRPIGGGCDIGAIEAMPPVQALTECNLTATHRLNFRDGPGGNRIGYVPVNASLTATARTPAWFQVDYRGASGWISADYVILQGNCE